MEMQGETKKQINSKTDLFTIDMANLMRSQMYKI